MYLCNHISIFNLAIPIVSNNRKSAKHSVYYVKTVYIICSKKKLYLLNIGIIQIKYDIDTVP